MKKVIQFVKGRRPGIERPCQDVAKSIYSLWILKSPRIMTAVSLKRLLTVNHGLKYSRNMGEAPKGLQQGGASLNLINGPVE